MAGDRCGQNAYSWRYLPRFRSIDKLSHPREGKSLMPESQDHPRGEDSKEDIPADDKSAEDQSSENAGDQQIGSGETPGPGGYEGRDPKTEMPRIPSVPETQDDEE